MDRYELLLHLRAWTSADGHAGPSRPTSRALPPSFVATNKTPSRPGETIAHHDLSHHGQDLGKLKQPDEAGTRLKPAHPAGHAQPLSGAAAAILQTRRAFIAHKRASDSTTAPALPPLIEPDDSQLRQIATLPIPEAIQLLERVGKDTERHQLASSLGYVWSVRDINLAWNSVTRSGLDAVSKQILYNSLWG